jgi:arylsulfatase A-like enzyme
MFNDLFLPLLLACSSGTSGDSVGETPPDSEGRTDSVVTDSGGTTDTQDPLGLLDRDAEAPELRNLIVVSIDTLRQSAVGWHSTKIDTPFLDSLADRAVVLQDHRSCGSWTLPSMLCYFSGQSTVDLGYEPIAMLGTDSGIPGDFEGLTGWFKADGWRTMLVPTNVLVSDRLPLGNDFDEVLWPTDVEDPGTAGAVVDSAESWLANNPWSADGQRVYMHLHLLGPHDPYDPDEAYAVEQPELAVPIESLDNLEKLAPILNQLTPAERNVIVNYLKALYDAEVRYLDDELSRLWTALEASGWLQDSLVLFMSDHGEGFYEHGKLDHGNSLFGEVVRVPAFLMAPGLAPANWSGATDHVDLAPTLLSMLEVEIPGSVTGFVVGQAPRDRIRLSLQVGVDSYPEITGVLGGKVLHYSWSGARVLYDLVADPGETLNIYDASSAEVADIWEVLGPAVESVSTWDGVPEPIAPGP